MGSVITFDGLRIKMDDRQFSLAAALSVLVGFVSGAGAPLVGLILLMGFDIVTGVLSSRSAGNKVESDLLTRGVAKKLIVLTVLLSVWVAVRMTITAIPGAPPDVLDNVISVAATFFGLAEIISILENAERAGVNIGPLKKMLNAAHAVHDKEVADDGSRKAR